MTAGAEATLRYDDPPVLASLVAQILREEGVTVTYEPPFEQRGAVENVATGVTVYDLCRGGDAANSAALRNIRERLVRGRVTEERDGEDR